MYLSWQFFLIQLFDLIPSFLLKIITYTYADTLLSRDFFHQTEKVRVTFLESYI